MHSELRGATSLVQEKRVSSPLVSAVIRILKRVDDFKKLAREFYFDVVLSVHQCPRCGGRIEMTGKSECSCVCGNIFDPTILFQKSPCCGKHLVRKPRHYICSGCQKTVPSMFLFDEKLFDKAYFREMVRNSRSRAAKRRDEMRRLLAESRSGVLIFADEPCLESIPGLIEDLDGFIGVEELMGDDFTPDMNSGFRIHDYRQHILQVLGCDSLLFSDIDILINDERRDKIWRFVTLIFMESEREVMLTQYGNDLLVERTSDEAYQ